MQVVGGAGSRRRLHRRPAGGFHGDLGERGLTTMDRRAVAGSPPPAGRDTGAVGAELDDAPRADDQIVYRRGGIDNILGALTYLIAGPFVGALFGLFAFLGTVGLLHGALGVGEGIAVPGGFGVGVLFVCLGLLWAY